MRYRARVGSLEPVKKGSWFRLLLEVEGIDNDFSRDHLWFPVINSKKQLSKLKLHQIIEFDAEEFKYLNKGTRLRKMRNIKIIKDNQWK